MALFHRASTSARTVHFSKKGPFVWILSAIMAGLVLLALREIQAGSRSLFAFFVLVAAVFFAWIALSTRYEIHDDELVVRSGPQRWRIPLQAIVEAAPAPRWSPGPALSIDRLQVNYVHDTGMLATIIISPARQEEFLGELGEAIRGAREGRGAPTWEGTHGSFRGRVSGERRIEF